MSYVILLGVQRNFFLKHIGTRGMFKNKGFEKLSKDLIFQHQTTYEPSLHVLKIWHKTHRKVNLIISSFLQVAMPQMPHQICFAFPINVASNFGSLLRNHVLSLTNRGGRLPDCLQMHSSGMSSWFQNHPCSFKPRANEAQSVRKIHRNNYWS